MLNTRLNVVVVLDRSGSMAGSEAATVDALNRYFASLRETPLCEAFVTLIMFDSESIDTVFASVPSAEARFLRDQFRPRGMTPLLDAVGAAIAHLDASTRDGELAALVVLTDGHENHSREYTIQKISALLTQRQAEKKWLVLFLGADIDAWGQGAALGMNRTRSLRVSKQRFRAASEVLVGATRRYVEQGDPDAAGFTDDERARVQEGSAATSTPTMPDASKLRWRPWRRGSSRRVEN